MTDVKERSLAVGAELTPETWADFVERLHHDCEGAGVSDHYTADAVFIVQSRQMIYGIDVDYAPRQVVLAYEDEWFSPQAYWEDCEQAEREALDELAQDDSGVDFLDLPEHERWGILGDLPEHTVTGCDERWEYVNSHFTKDAAEAFIRRKAHDYRKGLRIYVEAQVYCWEYSAIKKAILSGSLTLNTEQQP